MTVRKPRAARKPKVVETITQPIARGWDVVETSVPPSDQAPQSDDALDETLEQMSALFPIRFALAFANVARLGWGF